MTARTTMSDHPLVQAYLADLDRALAGADPRERAETVDAVREHLDTALPQEPTSDQVQEVLGELGPVEAIAAAATPAGPTAAPGQAPPSSRVDAFAVGTAVVAVVSAVLLLPVPFLAIPLALAALVGAVVHLRSGRPGRAWAWTAAVVAGATVLTGAVLALLLLSWGGSSSPAPGPVQTTAPLE